MSSWKDLLEETSVVGSAHDVLRRKYLAELAQRTGRNVILYYSGWLSQESVFAQQPDAFTVNDTDKNAFMATIHNLDRSKGLDLVLHTPGGSIGATESLVEYLHAMFGSDIRTIVPQIAMSAGTMIACASREVLMGKHSSIGPIDPQMGGLAAHAIIEEFEQAAAEIAQDPAKIAMWQPIIAKYHPTLIGECQRAIAWSNEMVQEWLESIMFANLSDAKSKSEQIVKELGDHALTKSHDRHIGMDRARAIGLNITALESDQDLQDAVLTVHHAAIQTLTGTGVVKLVENQDGVAFVQQVRVLSK